MKTTTSMLAAGALLAGCSTLPPDDHPEAAQTYSPTHGVNFGVPPGWDGKMDQWEAAGRPPFSPWDITPPAASPRQ